MAHEFGEIDRILAGILQSVRKTLFFRERNAPNTRYARTAQVEVHMQDAAPGLRIRNGERSGRNRLAFARLGGNNEKAMGHRLIARRIEQIAQAGDRLGEARILVHDQRLRHMFARPLPHVGQNRQNLQRQTPFDIREIDDRILQIVHDKDKEEPERDGQDNSGAEDDVGIGQNRILGLFGDRPHAHHLVVRFLLEARFVLVENQPGQDFACNIELVLQRSKSAFGKHNPLLDGRELRAQFTLLFV